MSAEEIADAAEYVIGKIDGMADGEAKRAAVKWTHLTCADTPAARPHDMGSILRAVWLTAEEIAAQRELHHDVLAVVRGGASTVNAVRGAMFGASPEARAPSFRATARVLADLRRMGLARSVFQIGRRGHLWSAVP